MTGNPNDGYSAAVWVSRNGGPLRFALLPLPKGAPTGTFGSPDVVSCGWGAGATCAIAGEVRTGSGT